MTTDLGPAATPRPVPSPEDRMRDARTDRPTTPIRGLRIFDQETSAAIRPLFDEIDQLRARAEAAEAERDEATEDRDQLRAENANLTAGLRAERVKTGRLEGDLRRQTQAVRELKVDLERADAQVKALAGTADTLHAVVEAAKLWRWWHGNTNAAYADACQALEAAVDALSQPQPPTLGSPRRAQEQPSAADLLRQAAAGRREYAKAIPEKAEPLELQAHTLEAAARVVEGDLSPLYDWLPSWKWTDEMHARLHDGRKPA